MKAIMIAKIPKGDFHWVEVTFSNGDRWIPSFRELGQILYLIGQCEDEKYPHGQGKKLSAEFFQEATLSDVSYGEFCRRKGISEQYTDRNKTQQARLL